MADNKRQILHHEIPTDLVVICNNLKKKESTFNKKEIIERIKNEKTLTGKCLLTRAYLPHSSTDFENICKQDLKIDPPQNSTSGDGNKNGINYEIKASMHAKKSKLNFVQIRPDHNIDYYIFIAYNMYENNCPIGKGHIFKIPSQDVYDLIVRYSSGYAHGSKSVLGKVTHDNIKGRNCEYALRCSATSGKSYELWKEFLKYEVEYNPDNF